MVYILKIFLNIFNRELLNRSSISLSDPERYTLTSKESDQKFDFAVN
jgi:hypothetical protein